MTQINIFLANNYAWFIIADIFVIFALIGYLQDPKNRNRAPKKMETIKFVDKNDVVEELNVQLGDKANKSLNSVIKSNNSKKKDDTEVL